MQGYTLPLELQMLRDTVRRFMREEVIPRERKLDYEDPHLPEDELKKVQALARETGLWCFGTPEEYGGAGLNLFGQTVVTEEMTQHRNGAYNAGMGAFGNNPPIMVVRHGTPHQIEKYVITNVRSGHHTFVAITEPTGGADPARSVRTRARRDGNKYILNGTKVFISEVDKSDWGVVFARTSDDPGRKGISAFIVDLKSPGLTWRFVPVIRAWYPTELVFEDCEVPAENLIGEEGQGFALADLWLTSGRVPYSAGCIGIAEAALRIAIDHARERSTFGTRLSERQSIQWMIADSDVELRAARWLTWEAAWKADRGENFRYEASVAKLYATEAANRVVDRCVQILGGYGVSKEFPLERWYRELRIKRIGEGPSEVHRMVIARDLLGTRG